VHLARIGEKRSAYRILVGKPERKRPLEIPSCRLMDNIKMDGIVSVGLMWLGTGTSGGLL
jgi:hypothetical protein